MNKMAAAVIDRKVKETASAVAQAAEEMITISRKTFTLEIAVALLGGIVLGMFLSPRKKVTYKIASNNRINADKDDEEEEEDDLSDEDSGEDEELQEKGKFIKL